MDTEDIKPQSKSKNLLPVIIISAVIIVAVLAVGIVLILRQLSAANTPVNTPPPVLSNLVVDENNLAEVQEAMQQQVEEGYFETDMNLIWSFEDSSSASSDAYVANSANNIFPMYFEVTLDDTGERVYSSSLIPVGMSLKDLTLQSDVPAGEHSATCTFHMVDDEGAEKGSVGLNVTLVVQG